jgi:CheY-like chemotaxis protein
VKLVLMHAPGASPPGDRETSVFDAALARPVRRQALHDVLSGLFEAGGRTAADCADSGPAEPDAARPPAHARGRVLLAEDNRTNRDIVLALLRRQGLEADTVSNGAEAVQAMAQGDYALVLMDVQMPVLDGLEATRRIRALPGEASRTPIVAMTAHAMNGDRERCLAAGMDDYVSKPLDPATFPAVLRRHLRRGRPSPSAQSHVPAGNRTTAHASIGPAWPTSSARCRRRTCDQSWRTGRPKPRPQFRRWARWPKGTTSCASLDSRTV